MNNWSVPSSPIAARRLLGTEVIPRSSRSASDRSDGSTPSGGPGSSCRSSPSSPAAMMAPSARYGLHDPSTALISMLLVSASRPQNGEAARTAACRLSYPQHLYEVDHERGCSRRYELKLGQVS